MNKKTSLLSLLSSVPILGYMLFGAGGGRGAELQSEIPEGRTEEGDNGEYSSEKAPYEHVPTVEKAADRSSEVRTVKLLGDQVDDGEINEGPDYEFIGDYDRNRYSRHLEKSKNLSYTLSHGLDRWKALDDGEKRKYRLWEGARIFNREVKKPSYTDGMKVYEDEVYQNEKRNGSIKKDKALEVVRTLKDYAIRFKTGCGGGGTGWFLDYEIPEGTKEYPTKWFMGVAAHTISRIN